MLRGGGLGEESEISVGGGGQDNISQKHGGRDVGRLVEGRRKSVEKGEKKEGGIGNRKWVVEAGCA